MCCFSTSIFSVLGLDFGGSWISNLGPSWAQNRFFGLLGSLLSFLELNVFSKLLLGGLKAQFWRLQGSILEPPKFDFNDFLDILGRFLPSKSSKTCLLKSTMPKMPKMLKSPTFFKVHRKEHDHKGLFYHRGRGKKRWAAVVPPPGVSITIYSSV